MSECAGIDSIFGGRSMPKPCSLDLRERVLDAVETGASRREAAERFEVSASSAVKWMQRWHETGYTLDVRKWPLAPDHVLMADGRYRS